MKTLVVAVSQKTPDWVRMAWDTYYRRLPADWPLELKEVKPAPRQEGKTAQQNMALEAQRLETTLKGRSCLKIALDERGKALTTQALHDLIERQQLQLPEVAFIIGGPDGLDPQFKQSCDLQIQLSALTLPHAMVKVLLIEQIYRIASIAANHPYHRD